MKWVLCGEHAGFNEFFDSNIKRIHDTPCNHPDRMQREAAHTVIRGLGEDIVNACEERLSVTVQVTTNQFTSQKDGGTSTVRGRAGLDKIRRLT